METWTSDLCDVSIDGFDHIVLNRTEKKPGLIFSLSEDISSFKNLNYWYKCFGIIS